MRAVQSGGSRSWPSPSRMSETRAQQTLTSVIEDQRQGVSEVGINAFQAPSHVTDMAREDGETRDPNLVQAFDTIRAHDNTAMRPHYTRAGIEEPGGNGKPCAVLHDASATDITHSRGLRGCGVDLDPDARSNRGILQ